MRLLLCLVMRLVSTLLFGLPHIAAAQRVAGPAIQSVTLQPDTGVLTITFSNTVGTNNVATGVQALYLNTVGNDKHGDGHERAL
jgi:hypothetical protein